MIEVEKSWQQFTSLPTDIQREVVDFIAFLHHKYKASTKPNESISGPISNEPFVGMWQHRTDMKDSSSWVRNLRQKEWQQ